MKLKDHTGKVMPAIDVFSEAIKFLKQHFEQVLKERLTTGRMGDEMIINKEQIRWVLTVPAIWSAKAKQFMRKAATKVGVTYACVCIYLMYTDNRIDNASH